MCSGGPQRIRRQNAKVYFQQYAVFSFFRQVVSEGVGSYVIVFQSSFTPLTPLYNIRGREDVNFRHEDILILYVLLYFSFGLRSLPSVFCFTYVLLSSKCIDLSKMVARMVGNDVFC